MNDEVFEMNDMDEDIKERKQLLEEAKQLAVEEDLNMAIKIANDLQKRWRRIEFWDSAYEEKLQDEFSSCLDVVYSKQNSLLGDKKEQKEKLIEKAKELVDTKDFRSATEEMKNLMDEWKTIGSAGRNVEEVLWEAFQNARTKFFENKNKHWEERQEKAANALNVKEDIVERAKAIAHSEKWQETSKAFKQLMNEWKEAGRAGKEEDRLWSAFREQQQTFFERQSIYYDERNAQEAQFFEQKSELLKQAKEILEARNFTREDSDTMKELSKKWKEIGSCRRDKENTLWQEFRSIMDQYFGGIKEARVQKQEQWRQNMMDVKARKVDLIQKQKRQIQYMQNEIVGLLGERAIKEMEEEIQEKEAFIVELEAEVNELEAKLAN